MTTEDILVAGYDRVFLAEAKAALTRCTKAAEAGNRPTALGGAAASAIVFSCAGLESFVSENRAFHLSRGTISGEESERIQDTDGAHAQLNQLVKCFDPEGLDRHTRYSSLVALVRLRGCIVHRHARYLLTSEWPEDVEDQRGVIPHIEAPGLDWTSRVLCERTARWAVETVTDILDAARKRIPSAPEGERVNLSVELTDGVVADDAVTESVISAGDEDSG